MEELEGCDGVNVKQYPDDNIKMEAKPQDTNIEQLNSPAVDKDTGKQTLHVFSRVETMQ